MNPSTSSNFISNISSDSSFSQNSPTNSKTYDIKLHQTQNLDVIMHLLDDCKIFTDMTWLVDGRTAFHRLMTLNHLYSTIRRMEQEIWTQKAKVMVILDQLIKERSCKWLWQYFWQNPKANWHKGWKFTPLISPTLSTSSFVYPEPKQSLISLLVPPLGTRGNLIVINNDKSDEEFPWRNGSGHVAQIVDNQDEPFNMVLACQMCGSLAHITQGCRAGLVWDPDMGFWYSSNNYGCHAQSVEVWA